MGDDGIVPAVQWTVDHGVRMYVNNRCLQPLAQLFPQGLRIWTVRWNRVLGSCVPVNPQPEFMFLLGAFSIYSTPRTL